MSTQPHETQRVADRPDDQVVNYCARPMCRREFRRSTGPGRPRDYCSETCRRSAQKELRVARLRLARFEALVEQFRKDVAAFTADSEGDLSDEASLRSQARAAVAEARGALPFLQKSEELGARALVTLYDGVAPYVDRARAE